MKRATFVIGAVLAVLFVTAGIAYEARGAPSPAKIRIVTTVFPLAEFARAVAGDRGDVTLILPPGAEIHTWQPRISDMTRIVAADLFIFIGQGLEPWARDLLRSAAKPGLKTLEAAKGVRLLDTGPDDPHHEEERIDPHVWLDFEVDGRIVDRIRQALTEIEPGSVSTFENNSVRYAEQLRMIDLDYRTELKTCERRVFLFGGHAAFGYLARRYGLEQVAIYGASPDAMPTPKELAGIIARAEKMRVTTVFFEPSLGDKMARLVATPLKADIRPLNPGHNLTGEEVEAGRTFLDLMRANLENLKHGLGCR